MSVLPLKEWILYGPVNSRRLGLSLGINLMPWRYKLCSFDCVYCQYGWTKYRTNEIDKFISEMPSLNKVAEAIEAAFKSKKEFDYITFSGNGEPTLYPQFPELVEIVRQLRDSYRSDVKIALLSNSTGLVRESVKASIDKIDMPMFKLDAGNERLFKSINNPPPEIKFDDIIDNLASLNNIIIQTLLIDGEPSNVKDEDLIEYFALIKRIKPLEVHIYSIDRPVPDKAIKWVPPVELSEIAALGEKETGVNFKSFSLYE